MSDVHEMEEFTPKSYDLKDGLQKLMQSIRYGMEVNASPRTRRYFLKMEDEFSERLENVVITLDCLRRTSGTFIQAKDGETYGLSEYTVPSALVDFISYGRIYGSPDSVGRDVDYVLDDIEKTEDALTPTAFNRFFADFNSNQEEEFKLETVSVKEKRPIVLSEVPYARMGESMVRLFCQENNLDVFTPYIVEVPYIFSGNYFVKVPSPTVEGIAEWLFNSRK